MENLMGRYRNISILAAAIFIQILGLAIQVKRRAENQADSTRLIRVWTVSAVTPLEKGIVRLQTGASDIWHNYFYLRGVRQQNRDLQQQIQQMQLEQVRLRQDAEQARRLQTLLGFKEQFIDKTVAAQVIGSSGSEQSRSVYIDKGSDDGIATDMAVITADGIVGKVLRVTDGSTSQVLLINDQTSGIGTILEQSRLQGVLKGKPSGELVLDKIMAEEEVKPGERVLTSGGDQIFPKGLPVGTVAKVFRGTEFLQVTVRPAAALNHLEEVLVITKKEEKQPAVLTGAPVRAADILAQRLPSVPDQPSAADSAAADSGPPKPIAPQSAKNAKPAGSSSGAQQTTQPKTQSALGLGSSSSQAAAKPASQAQTSAGQASTHLVPAAAPIQAQTPAQAINSPGQSKPAANSTVPSKPASGTATASNSSKTVVKPPVSPSVKQPSPSGPKATADSAPSSPPPAADDPQ